MNIQTFLVTVLELLHFLIRMDGRTGGGTDPNYRKGFFLLSPPTNLSNYASHNTKLYKSHSKMNTSIMRGKLNQLINEKYPRFLNFYEKNAKYRYFFFIWFLNKELKKEQLLFYEE